MNEALVGVYHAEPIITYPQEPPYSPVVAFPEYPFAHSTLADASDPAAGRVYSGVRQLLYQLRLDAAHFDTPVWNPLGELVQPGNTVVLKPNLVQHWHGWGWDIHSVITHGSVVRAVLDYVCIALRGCGRIIVGDAPLQTTDFAQVVQAAGLDGVVEFFAAQGVPIGLIDFRQSQSTTAIDGVIVRHAAAGDPNGSTPVDLGTASWLQPIAPSHSRYRVTNYDPAEMSRHHNLETNEYLIANSILRADVVINLPKMKTHRKVGMTGALKNLVGINAHKDWLPHHRQGARAEGGDEYREADRLKAVWSQLIDRQNAPHDPVTKRAYYYSQRGLGVVVRWLQRDQYSEGSWYGNDTLWRTVLDLNRILYYAGQDGKLSTAQQKRVFCIVDGIVAGEGEGPLEPTAKPVGMLVGGANSATVDAVVARLMGFDYRQIPVIREAFKPAVYPLAAVTPEAIQVTSNSPVWNHLQLAAPGASLSFKPPAGWAGHIELLDGHRTRPTAEHRRAAGHAHDAHG
jgi:uncharacterized protein (DUF362 family)